ncbi:metal ABC transporter substrate-binding protein [Haloterrigena alkaliphila]|uniref:Metal ABC transporter substrate-binding protein n=1 Tax=Haloterrigena alkaliphila TaxID=2816475 RepID=A0A8A2VDD3_9EURY|nr:metal ABC transporter substrate-binding protein [Haloterrigena alkaliphila]QSW98444.1 metal ABC transporter substrate-binding protein [Haloterrigena alkaliphila]
MPHETYDGRAVTRRDALRAGGAAAVAGLAGCTALPDAPVQSGSNGDNGSDGPVAVASFFSFYDFGRQIADGTPLTVENLVPTGLHGHGWEPNASITRRIIEADAFIHVGGEFQPWADRAIQTIKGDDVDTALINVRKGIDLVDLAATLDREEEGVGAQRGKDPHFWLDPRRAKQSVDNIADGLADIVPEHADAVRENAETYKTDVLDRIDADYEAIFDRAERDIVQLAAHNAFQYIGERYGVRMRPLVTNLAASGDVKPADVREAEAVIRENDIRYIANGVFESQRPAQQLVRETGVEAYFPVTPYAGVREEWVAEDWGYEEIADNINMPTFEIVLGNGTPADAAPSEEWLEQWRNFEPI